MRIDAHHHFWKYDPVEYDWIRPEMAVLRRDFLPEHLEETPLPPGSTASSPCRRGKVSRKPPGCWNWRATPVDQGRGRLGAAGFSRRGGVLERFAAEPKLGASATCCKAKPDERYMLRDDFNAGIRALRRFGLVYDILIFERHLPQTIEFVDRHPGRCLSSITSRSRGSRMDCSSRGTKIFVNCAPGKRFLQNVRHGDGSGLAGVDR